MRWGAPIILLAALAPLGAASAQGDGDSVIDARIRASAAAAQSQQGPLDGAWTVVSTEGKALFAFQIVDKPGGQDPLEGVWRDLRRPPTPGDIRFIDSLQRGPGMLTINFLAAPGAAPTTLQLTLGSDGAWKGELREAGGVIAVQMRRG